MCGYDVRVLPIIGAGASLLSKGFVDSARRHARKTLELVNQLDPAREAFIVGVEPPEMYLLKNDYVDLLPDRSEEALQRAQKVWLLDEFLLRSKIFDILRVGTLANQNLLEDQKQKIKFHPHCHQRAEGPSADGIASGAKASVELLSACGYEVELSYAGCCGMAGTFGFEAEHYEISMKIFEIFASRETESKEWNVDRGKSSIENRQSQIVSTGAACRMQIQHGLGINARHPIEWVRDSLK